VEPSDRIGDLPVIATSSQGPLDAAFRVRLELPGRGLAAHGIAMQLLPFFRGDDAQRFRSAGALGKARLLAASRRRLRHELRDVGEAASTVVVQRQVDLAPPLALERAAARGRRLIYDVDDAVWLSGRQTGGHPLSVLKGAARKVRWLAERAEHTIAGNEILAEHLAAHSERVTVVPSLVDPAAYAVRVHEQGETLTLGWIGSPTTAPYLAGIAPVLERFAKQSSRAVRLLVVGGSIAEIAGVRVEERAWSPQAEHEALAEMDIGLMPLADTPWTRGKCAYKALQYMAAGIPPVADDVGVSGATVGGAGYAVVGAERWLEALRALADDVGLRARLSAVGRRRVEEEFSPDRWLPTIAAILKTAREP
jgi:glycosyltransferase involved in cell wall biosynthesis